jgi:hypothetical protein
VVQKKFPCMKIEIRRIANSICNLFLQMIFFCEFLKANVGLNILLKFRVCNNRSFQMLVHVHLSLITGTCVMALLVLA